jgi:hypothetical protein
MAEINGEATAPGAGKGSAYILGRSGPDALSILINGQRSRDRAAAFEAAARAKAQAEDYKDWNARVAGLNNTTGPTYQRYASEQRTMLGTKLEAIHADPKMSRQEKSFKANELIDQTQIGLAAGKQIDDQNAKIKLDYGNDKEINQEKFWQDLHAKQFQSLPDGKPDMSRPVAPLDYDQTTPEQLLQDRKYLNPSVLYKNFAATLAPKKTTQQAVGGKPGTMSTTYSNEVRLWKQNTDGSPMLNRNGDMEMNITDSLTESALGNERIKRDLQGMMGEHDALTKSGEAKMANYEQLTPEERGALEVEPTMKDLLGRRLTEFALASHRETQRYNRYPRPTAAAGGKPKANDVVPDSGAFGEYNLPAKTDAGRDYSTAKPLYPGGLAIPTTRRYANSQETLGGGGKPMRVNGKEVATVGSQITGIERHDENGHWMRDVTNKPFAGTYGNWFSDVRDKKTGFRVTDKTKAEKAQMLREGKGEVANYINGYSIGKKDYTASHDETLKKLQAANPVEGMAGHKADPVLEDEARRIATTGSEPVVFPYNEQNARVIDPETQNFYRGSLAKRQQIANEARQQPAQTPKGKSARPTFLKSKSAPAARPAANPTNQAADKSGGMLD